MEVGWGEGDGGGVEAPEPPRRPLEAAALRVAGRLAGTARRPTEAEREVELWRLAATAGNTLAATATEVTGETGLAWSA